MTDHQNCSAGIEYAELDNKGLDAAVEAYWDAEGGTFKGLMAAIAAYLQATGNGTSNGRTTKPELTGSPSGTPHGAGVLPTPEHGVIKNGRYFNTGKTYWPDGTVKFDFDARNATDPWFNGTISNDGFINDYD